jgi:hypothetical protein
VERTHEDIFREQTQLSVEIAKIGVQLTAIGHQLDFRHEQMLEMKKATDEALARLRKDTELGHETICRTIERQRQDLEEVREMNRTRLELHAKENNTEIKRIDAKLLTFTGAMSVVVFALTAFAPVIQRTIWHSGGVDAPVYQSK